MNYWKKSVALRKLDAAVGGPGHAPGFAEPSRIPGSWAAVVLAVCLFFSPGLFPDLSVAQEQAPEYASGLGIGLGVAPFYRFPAKVDGGGTLSTTNLIFHADIFRQVNPKLKLGLGFTYDYTNYDFSGLTNFPVAKPWRDVQRLGFSLPVICTLADKWRLIITPTAQFSGEVGANFGDSLVYGGAVAVTYAFRPDAVFGLGVAGYAKLAELSIFPFPVIRWQITPKLRLTNPFRTSPAGPAGLELSYAFAEHWTVGLGGAYRSERFRLDANGPLPNDIGEYKSVPTFVRLSYKPVPFFGVDLYSGVSFLNKLYIDDSSGDNLYKTRHNITPLLGLSVSGTF
jgi:Domain of unknown function (DUF6268)